MDELLNEIYHIVEENLDPAFRADPQYKCCSDKVERLWDQIAANLGQGGNTRLNDFMNAWADEDDFWRRPCSDKHWCWASLWAGWRVNRPFDWPCGR